MKKLISKIHYKLYLHYSKKARKYWLKFIGAKRYKPEKYSKEVRVYVKNDDKLMKSFLNSVYGISVYADTDSVKR